MFTPGRETRSESPRVVDQGPWKQSQQQEFVCLRRKEQGKQGREEAELGET